MKSIEKLTRKLEELDVLRTQAFEEYQNELTAEQEAFEVEVREIRDKAEREHLEQVKKQQDEDDKENNGRGEANSKRPEK